MVEVTPNVLWLGNAGDLRKPALLMDRGVAAVVDLAVEEPVAKLPREIVYCRVPLVDGSGNPREMLRLAVETVATLMCEGIPTLVCCSAGMSRSPSIAAFALARVHNRSPAHCLRAVATMKSHDVSPALWRELTVACRNDHLTDGGNKIIRRGKLAINKKIVAGALALARMGRSLPANQITLDFDEGADVLYISLHIPRNATNTIQLDDSGILLCYRGRKLVGIDVLNASRR